MATNQQKKDTMLNKLPRSGMGKLRPGSRTRPVEFGNPAVQTCLNYIIALYCDHTTRPIACNANIFPTDGVEKAKSILAFMHDV